MSDDRGQPDLSALYAEFLDESRELLDALARDLVDLERRSEDADLLHRVFRAAHSLKGNAGFMGMEALATLAHSLENVLARVRSGALAPAPALLDLLLQGLDACRRLLAAGPGTAERPSELDELLARLAGCLGPSSQEGPGPASPPSGGSESPNALGASPAAGSEALSTLAASPTASPAASQEGPDRASSRSAGSEPLSTLGASLAADRSDTPSPSGPERFRASGGTDPALTADRSDTPSPSGPERLRASGGTDPALTATLRVSTPRLDRLVNLVGELMAARSRLATLAREIGDRRLDEVASGVSRLADQLQAEVLSIRMVPIRTLFQRFHRLVRDTARDLGRAVTLELAGEATELDKAIIEALHDPLVHLVRNAIGHGIETPEARRAAGKRAEGTLRLSARHARDHVVVEVADDGRGIEEAAVRRRAVETGLLPADEAAAPLSMDAVRRLVFTPGFSTAARVDRLSGRGVGLDVVRTAVEAMGGSVEIATRPGEGTSFVLRAPLTLAMIQIFIVRVRERLYGLPLPQVDEALRVAPRSLEAVGRQRVLLLRGRAVPVVVLADLVGQAAGDGAGDGAETAEAALRPLVVVRHGARRIGFLVDDVYGKEKTVLKPLGHFVARLPRPVRGIAGASLLGTGELVLVADVAGLAGQVAEAVPA